MNKDLTTGKPEKVLWQFCLPLFGSIIFQQLYNIADSFVAGKFISDNAHSPPSATATKLRSFSSPLPSAATSRVRFWRRCFSARSSIMTSRRRSTRRSFPAA